MTDREYEEFQRYRRRKRRKHVWTFILTLLLVLLAGTCLLWYLGPLKHRAAETISRTIVNNAAQSAAQQIEQSTGGAISADQAQQEIQQAMDNMSPEDQETLTGIIENHMDGSEAADIAGYIASGDTAGALQYAEQNLSPEENQKLQALLNKYLAN